MFFFISQHPAQIENQIHRIPGDFLRGILYIAPDAVKILPVGRRQKHLPARLSKNGFSPVIKDHDMRRQILVRPFHFSDIIPGIPPVPVQVSDGKMKFIGSRIYRRPAYRLPDHTELYPLCGAASVQFGYHIHIPALLYIGKRIFYRHQQIDVTFLPAKTSHRQGAVQIDPSEIVPQDFSASFRKFCQQTLARALHFQILTASSRAMAAIQSFSSSLDSLARLRASHFSASRLSAA